MEASARNTCVNRRVARLNAPRASRGRVNEGKGRQGSVFFFSSNRWQEKMYSVSACTENYAPISLTSVYILLESKRSGNTLPPLTLTISKGRKKIPKVMMSMFL